MKKSIAIALILAMLSGMAAVNASAAEPQGNGMADIVSVEIPDLEKYLTAEECYDGTYNHIIFGEEPVNVKVNFIDGTSQTIYYDCNNEPQSREVIHPGFDNDVAVLEIYHTLDERANGTGKFYLVVEFEHGDYSGWEKTGYKAYECTVTEASISSNMKALNARINGYVGLIERTLSIESSENIEDIFTDIGWCLIYVMHIFREITECIADCII